MVSNKKYSLADNFRYDEVPKDAEANIHAYRLPTHVKEGIKPADGTIPEKPCAKKANQNTGVEPPHLAVYVLA